MALEYSSQSLQSTPSEPMPEERKLFRFNFESSLNICDMVLAEKKRTMEYKESMTNTRRSLIRPFFRWGGNYRTVDFVQFHQIVATGGISIQVVSSQMGIRLVLCEPLEVEFVFGGSGTDLKETKIAHPLIDKLRRPLDSTECPGQYALIAERQFLDTRDKVKLLWELTGILTPLHDGQEMKLEAEYVARLRHPKKMDNDSHSDETDYSEMESTDEEVMEWADSDTSDSEIDIGESLPSNNMQQHRSSSSVQHETTQRTSKKNRIHRCPFCIYGNPCRTALKSHVVEAHHNASVYRLGQCPDCDYITTDRRRFQNHVKAKHSYSPIDFCPFCCFISKSEHEVKKHVAEKHASQMN